MELRQLRYFVRVVELGSMGKAAAEFGVVTSAVSQQISRLEGELATRLLQRTTGGVVATDAGIAFLQQVQLALRHTDGAVLAAQRARLSGQVSVGLGPSIAAIMGLTFINAMHARYPDVRLRLVEGLSGSLNTMLQSRQLDLCVLFESDVTRGWSAIPLLHEPLFIIGSRRLPGMPAGSKARLRDIAKLPLILPGPGHNLRTLVDEGFSRAKARPNVALEIDGVALLMDAVRAGLGATIQPGAATSRLGVDELRMIQVGDSGFIRRTLIASLSDDELSPAALAARIVLAEVARSLASSGVWMGATLV